MCQPPVLPLFPAASKRQERRQRSAGPRKSAKTGHEKQDVCTSEMNSTASVWGSYDQDVKSQEDLGSTSQLAAPQELFLHLLGKQATVCYWQARVSMRTLQRLYKIDWKCNMNAAAVIDSQIHPVCNRQVARPSWWIGPKDSRTCSLKQCAQSTLKIMSKFGSTAKGSVLPSRDGTVMEKLEIVAMVPM